MADLIVWVTGEGPAAACEFAGKRYGCIVGRGGAVDPALKTEGDGKTPLGRWKIIGGYYRPDKVAQPAGERVWVALDKTMGWCDAVGDVRYNRPVPVGYAASHEVMWRNDDGYDYVLVLDHNQLPVVDNRGSAIFLHVWREGVGHTEGCVALRKADLEEVLDAEAVDVRLG